MRGSLLLVFLLLAPAAQAALNPVMPFTTETQYTDSFDAIEALVAAEVTLEAPRATNGSLFLGAQEFTITDLTRLYWTDSNGDVQYRDSEGMQVHVLDNSSVAFRHPGEYDVAFNAAHAFSFFGDAASMFGDGIPEDVDFGPALVALPIDGTAQLTNLDDLPETPLSYQTNFNDFIDESAMLLSFTPNSGLALIDGNGDLIETLSGAGRWVAFQGTPRVGPIAATIVALPTPAGSVTTFSPAEGAAAQEGTSPEHLADAIAVLAASEGAQDAAALDQVGSAAEAVAPLINGAFLGIEETSGNSSLVDGLTIVRFEQIQATRNGDELEWQGTARLQIENGQVAGADSLIGIFPWWSLLLWAIALGAFVLRLAIRPDKHHEVWDKFGWVGIVGGVAASAIVFWLWDLETKALWGTSILSSDGATATATIAVFQIIPLMLAGIAIGLPLRMIAKSGTRFAKQGNLMRIGAIIAPFAVLLLGAPLMLDYLQLLIDNADKIPVPGT